jgi:hypothetical protein
MNKVIEIITKPRLSIAGIINGLSIEQLNKVPAGFNNNIIWNMGHLVSVQQILCYRRAGVEPIIDAVFIDTYAPGTKPERFITAEELERIQQLFTTTIDQLEADMQTDLFNNYTAWTTRMGININNINDAMNFLNFHEGMHVGYIMALKRAIFAA